MKDEEISEEIRLALNNVCPICRERIYLGQETAHTKKGVYHLECYKSQTIQSIRDVIKGVVPSSWLHPFLKSLVIKTKITAKDVEDLLRKIKEELLSQLDDVSLNNSQSNKKDIILSDKSSTQTDSVKSDISTQLGCERKDMSSMALEMGKYVDSKLETSNTCICGQRLMCKKCWEQHLCLRGCPNFINSLNCQKFKPKDKTLGEVKHG